MSDEILTEFLTESTESLDLLDRELVKLEQDPSSRETLSSIFRRIHSVKGACGFLGFVRLERVAHAGENLLSLLREGTLPVNVGRTTALLQLVDAIRETLATISECGKEGERDDSALIANLERLQKSEAPPSEDAKAAAAIPEAQVTVSSPAEPPQSPVQEIVAGDLETTGTAAAENHEAAHDGDSRLLGGASAIDTAIKERDTSQGTSQQTSKVAATDASIRVDVTLLDRLMTLVGELVLARNQILQSTQLVEDSTLAASSQRLNLITTELQEGVMKTRMQPIGNIWSKFPRTVRDVAISCGKQVRIEMEGKDTELDKTILESVRDPLTHLVRNAVDHGIETPEKRIAAGKPPEGLLHLRAYHEGGQVTIEVTDDGVGLNLEKIRAKALRNGLITAEQAARIGDRETVNLIFVPGFSTADVVTNVSGRGVGMDVVKTNVEKIGGTVDVVSRAGAGSTVKMKIPLTLAIIPALLVTSGGERFAIPQVSLLELLRIEEQNVSKSIEYVNGVPVYRLRGKLLPLVYLNKVLEFHGNERPGEGGVNIIVLQADGQQFGLIVDGVRDTEEIVVKPMCKQLKSIHAYAGATILGDGKVALILDVRGIAQAAGLLDKGREKTKTDATEADHTDSEITEKQTLLVFESSPRSRMAIELSQVARLEEFEQKMIEHAGDCEVVQYRGQIMPLVDVAATLSGRKNCAPRSAQERMQVVVCSENGRRVGLVVDRILDIVEERLVIEQPAQRNAIRGSAVIQKQVTDLLDIPGLLQTAAAERRL